MDDLLNPGPFKYDGVVREASYLQRQVLAAWDIHLGVTKPNTKNPDAEDAARIEHAALQVALTHAKNVVRALATRRDALADVLTLAERPRVEAAHEEANRRTRAISPEDRAAAQRALDAARTLDGEREDDGA